MTQISGRVAAVMQGKGRRHELTIKVFLDRSARDCVSLVRHSSHEESGFGMSPLIDLIRFVLDSRDNKMKSN